MIMSSRKLIALVAGSLLAVSACEDSGGTAKKKDAGSDASSVVGAGGAGRGGSGGGGSGGAAIVDAGLAGDVSRVTPDTAPSGDGPRPGIDTVVAVDQAPGVADMAPAMLVPDAGADAAAPGVDAPADMVPPSSDTAPVMPDAPADAPAAQPDSNPSVDMAVASDAVVLTDAELVDAVSTSDLGTPVLTADAGDAAGPSDDASTDGSTVDAVTSVDAEVDAMSADAHTDAEPTDAMSTDAEIDSM